MKMTRKSALYALAVVVAVVMAIGTAGPVLAHSEGAGGYGTTHPPESGEIREPMETGALPGESGKGMVDSQGYLNMDSLEQSTSPELQGLPNLQDGGGGGE
jgi:hypothetical protein